LVLRSEVDTVSLAGEVREAVPRVDPDLSVSDLRTMDEILGAALARRQFNALLTDFFATMALVLVAVGLYGTMSLFVGAKARRADNGARVEAKA